MSAAGQFTANTAKRHDVRLAPLVRYAECGNQFFRNVSVRRRDELTRSNDLAFGEPLHGEACQIIRRAYPKIASEPANRLDDLKRSSP